MASVATRDKRRLVELEQAASLCPLRSRMRGEKPTRALQEVEARLRELKGVIDQSTAQLQSRWFPDHPQFPDRGSYTRWREAVRGAKRVAEEEYRELKEEVKRRRDEAVLNLGGVADPNDGDAVMAGAYSVLKALAGRAPDVTPQEWAVIDTVRLYLRRQGLPGY